LLGTTLAVTIDGAGNIIDDTGKLVGRVNKDTTTLAKGSLSMSGRMMTVSVDQNGQMLDSSGANIGHILGAEPAKIETAQDNKSTAVQATSQSSSWTDEDALKDAAPKLHGPIEK